MRRSLFIGFALFAIFSVSRPVHANLELEFSVHAEALQGPDGKDTVMHDSLLAVVLGDGFISWSEGRERTIYDFRKKRIYTVRLDPKKNIYADDSLFTVIGFRAAEFERREELADTLQNSTIKKQLVTTAFIENLYSIAAAQGHAKVSEVRGNNSIVYKAEGRDLISWSTDGTAVEDGEMRQFVRFFRYYLGGHPSVIRQLQAVGKVPKNIRFFIYDIGREEVLSLSLVSLHRTEEAPYTLGGSAPGVLPADEDEVSRIIQAGRPETPGSIEKRNTAALKAAREALSNGRPLDSMLGYLEYTLQTGKPLPLSYKQNQRSLQRSKHVKKLLASLDPKTPEQAREAALALQQLRAVSYSHKHVLMVFEARSRARFGDPAEPRALLIAALKQNPFLTTAYKELGDLSYRSFDMRQAWRCWERCRQLAPEFREMKDVNELEQRLLSDYAEFF